MGWKRICQHHQESKQRIAVTSCDVCVRQLPVSRVTGKVPLADSTLPASALIRTLRRCMLAETSLVGVGCKHEEVVPHCASDIGWLCNRSNSSDSPTVFQSRHFPGPCLRVGSASRKANCIAFP